jgi:hypothetical protein
MAQVEAVATTDRARVVTDLGGDLELRGDGVVRKRGLTTAARAVDVPERTDLPRAHPLYGQRVVRVVPSGMSDCAVDTDGRLVPAVAGDARGVVEPEIVER